MPGTTTTAPERRWLRFSLRTLLVVVTVFGLGVAWQVNTIRDRRATLQVIQNVGGQAADYGRDPYSYEDFKNPPQNRIPLLRRALGDKGVGYIFLPQGTDPRIVDKIRQTFPEAEVEVTVP